MKHTTCDRCHNPIPANALANEVLREEYPDQDICPNCDIEIKMAGTIASKASLFQIKPEEYLKRWCGEYDLKVGGTWTE